MNLKDFLNTSYGRLLFIVVFYIIVFALIFLLIQSGNNFITLTIMLMCTFFGWISLNRIQPTVFLWVSVLGWIIYIIIKLSLAYIIGVFVAPYIISKKVLLLLMDRNY